MQSFMGRLALLREAMWAPVVRDTARHGLEGQVGVASAEAEPTSMIRAEAGAAHTSTASTEPATMVLRRRGIPAFNTTDRPGLWWSAAALRAS